MSDYSRVRTPFVNMSFTPDVPSNALGPNEYNIGLNVESDVRGVKNVDGEVNVLSNIPGTVIYMAGGFRNNNQWVYICATAQGKWYMVTSSGISNITPGVGANPNVALSGYSDALDITGSWVGEVFFLNDTINPPMYFGPTQTEIYLYDHAPNNYVWNYESTLGVTAVQAGFMRNYSSPNVGNILVAGNLTKTKSGTVTNYPTTVRWSQAFAITGEPATWNPTITNVANEQEVAVRGPLIDGFYLGANFYLCSYWDTVIMAPLAYQSSTAPVFSVAPFSIGRGLLNQNCWANVDNVVFGVDARDIWMFNGTEFIPLGNQKVKKYFYANLNPAYYNHVFLVNNSAKYQIEIYYPDLTSSGYCNKMISYRYDLQIWNAPKTVQNACMGCESPVLTSGQFNIASRCVTYAQGDTTNSQLVQTAQGTSFNGSAINALFQRDNIAMADEKGPIPYSSKIYTHRVLPEVAGSGTISLTVGGSDSISQTPWYGDPGILKLGTGSPWVATTQNNVRLASIKVASNDTSSSWNLTAMNWQVTKTEDAF